jgi:hypothetical protein
MKTRRDSVRSYVVQGAAMGVGAFIGAAIVTVALAFIAKRLPFAVQILPRPNP